MGLVEGFAGLDAGVAALRCGVVAVGAGRDDGGFAVVALAVELELAVAH